MSSKATAKQSLMSEDDVGRAFINYMDQFTDDKVVVREPMPTILGFMKYLGVSKVEYEYLRRDYPALFGKIEIDLELSGQSMLLSKNGVPPSNIIFYMKNQFGWMDVKANKVDFGGDIKVSITNYADTKEERRPKGKK